MTEQIPDDDATGWQNPQEPPGRAPRGLERLATSGLKAKADDSRLGDLSELYVRTHERVRAYLGDSPLAVALSRLAADIRYLFSTANVMLFARPADPVQQLAATSAKETIALDVKERTMAMLHTGARKMVLPALLLVGAAFLINGAVNVWTTWREAEALMVDLQREKAEAAAARINQFIASIKSQLAWTSFPQLTASTNPLKARRYDFLKLQRQVKEITEVIYIDAQGREQVFESRLKMSDLGSGKDLRQDPRFKVASQGRTYFGPVEFRKKTEPYMAIAVPAGKHDGAGVTAVGVNLKFMWEVIRGIHIGKAGFAYVVDSEGRLIAHPDIALVLQKTDLSTLPQVAAALRATPSRMQVEDRTFDTSTSGEPVISVRAPVAATGWTVFVELPVAEARAPLWTALIRAASLLVLGLLAIYLASVLAARRVPPAQPAGT